MHDAFRSVRTRTVQSGAKVLALGLAGLIAACASKPVRLDEWGGAQNCHFAHVTKGNFDSALHRVFEASGPKIYGLRPEGGGALVEQHWTLDVVFASSSGVERWRLEYAPAGDGVDVHAEVEHAPKSGLTAAGKEKQPLGDAAKYQLLWLRIQYVLGRRGDWPACESPSKIARSGLCSSGASDQPPLRLARSR